MTSVIHPIFLVIKTQEPTARHPGAITDLIGFNPMLQDCQTYRMDLSKKKFSQLWPEFRAWCKGGSRNSRVVLIAHQEANRYRTMLENETVKLKDKLPKTWQVFDTADLSKEIANTTILSDLKSRYRITHQNEAQAIRELLCAMTPGVDAGKIYESMFKVNADKVILELIKTNAVAVPQIVQEPAKLNECYFHLETMSVFDRNFVDRITSLSAFIPSRFGEDAFFTRMINPETVVNNDYQHKPKLKSVLSQFIAWVESGDEQSRTLLISYNGSDSFEKLLKNESMRVKVQLPTHWTMIDLQALLKSHYPKEEDGGLSLQRMAERFKVEQKGTLLQLLAGLVDALSGEKLLQGIVNHTVEQLLPQQLPQEVPAQCNQEIDVFYFKNQEMQEVLGPVIEDFPV